MLASSSIRARGSKVLQSSIAIFAASMLTTTVCWAGANKNVDVRRIGQVHGVVGSPIAKQVHLRPLDFGHASPILLRAETLDELNGREMQEIKATYQAGHAIVVLDATMGDINALHRIIGEGVAFRSKDTGVVLAYSLRRDNFTPTCTMLTDVDRSPLQTPLGDPEPTAIDDEEMAVSRVVDRTLGELTHVPNPGVSGQSHDPNGTVDWLANPIQTCTFAINSPQGVYNTFINVYALHRCLDGTDHYAVTAQADWTATNAKWQGATTEDPNPTMRRDKNGNLVVDWQDNRTYCSSPGAGEQFQDLCRYVNYPLSYDLKMVPLVEGAVIQIAAVPGAMQGQQTSYTSGFSFQIGGTVNVSAAGPGGGISAGASWSNTVTTTVPPLLVDVSNTGNEGVDWNFKYCTTGHEPDSGTDCTNHVQMTRDVCIAQLGDDSGSNPQQGQTPVGKFSNAVQSVRWQTTSRVGSTFDIEVSFQANTATTLAHLNNGDGKRPLVDPIQGCNSFGCACTSVTTANPVVKSFTFEIPYPSTKCQ